MSFKKNGDLFRPSLHLLSAPATPEAIGSLPGKTVSLLTIEILVGSVPPSSAWILLTVIWYPCILSCCCFILKFQLSHSGQTLRPYRLCSASFQGVPFTKTTTWMVSSDSVRSSACTADHPLACLGGPVVWMIFLPLMLLLHILVSTATFSTWLVLAFEMPITFVPASLRWRCQKCILCSF